MRLSHACRSLASRAARAAGSGAGGLVLRRRRVAGLHAVGGVAAGGSAGNGHGAPAVRAWPPRRHSDHRGGTPAGQCGPGPRRARRRAARARWRGRRHRSGAARRVRDGHGRVRASSADVAPQRAEGDAARGHHTGAHTRAARRARWISPSSPRHRPSGRRTPSLRPSSSPRSSERELVLGVPAHHPFASAGMVDVAQLEGQVWVASRSDAGESLLGVWPGLAERPDVRYVVRDWLAKLQIVGPAWRSRRWRRSRATCSETASRSSQSAASPVRHAAWFWPVARVRSTAPLRGSRTR